MEVQSKQSGRLEGADDERGSDNRELMEGPKLEMGVESLRDQWRPRRIRAPQPTARNQPQRTVQPQNIPAPHLTASKPARSTEPLIVISFLMSYSQ